MLKKLIKCLTVSEIYFVKVVLSDCDRIIDVNIVKLAKEYRMSPATIRNAIRILEVTGVIETWSAGKGKLVKVIDKKMINALVNTLDD